MPPSLSLLTLERVLVVVAVALIALTWKPFFSAQRIAPEAAEQREYECAEKPHHASWDSWWHPQRVWEKEKASLPGAGTSTKDWKDRKSTRLNSSHWE